MDFKQLLHVLRRRWITIVAMLLVAAGVVTFINWQMDTEVRVEDSSLHRAQPAGRPRDTTAALLPGHHRAQSYADLADSTDLMNLVISDLDLDVTPSELADEIDAEVVQDTTLIDVTVHNADPEQAQAIARVHAQRYTEFLSDLEAPSDSSRSPGSSPGSPTPPRFNGSSVSPRTWLNYAVGLHHRAADRHRRRDRPAHPGPHGQLAGAHRGGHRQAGPGEHRLRRWDQEEPAAHRPRVVRATHRGVPACCAPTCSSSTSTASPAAW